MKFARLFGLLCLLASSVAAAEMSFFGPGYLGDARAVATAPNGDIWVGCSGWIVSFAPDGTFKSVLHKEREQVNSMVFDAKGNLIVGYNNSGIEYFREKEPMRIAQSYFKGYPPFEIALDKQGMLLATDGGNGNIKKFSISGPTEALVQTITAPAPNAMQSPFSLALDRQGPHL